MDRTGIVLRDKRIAELMEMVSEQQRVIVALQAWNEELQHEVEELRRELRATATGKPKGMPGNKRGAGKAAKSGAEGEPKQERKKREQNFARPRSPEPTEKYFVRGDRSSGMVRAVLGEEFRGVLVSDFYAAYDCYGGYHQQGAKRLPVRAVRRHRTVGRTCCGTSATCSRCTPRSRS